VKLYQLSISALLSAVIGAPAAMADVVDQVKYTINFTGTGTLPTAGSFTWDPDTTSFAAFSVTWDGTTFDLTSDANAPFIFPATPPCLGGATGAAGSFALLTGACTPAPPGFVTSWNAGAPIGDTDRLFGFETNLPPDSLEIILVADLIFNNPTAVSGHGQWTATPAAAAVPEPSSLLLAALSLCALVARRRLTVR
jgi:hypothetical protein